MKNSIWDILTGITLLGILCLVGAFGAILMNPSVPFNPLGPPEPIPTIVIPTATNTPLQMPATWTPSPMPQQVVLPEATEQPQGEQNPGVAPTLRPSSTPLPTNTVVVLPTFTPTKKGSTSGGGGGGSGVGGGNCTVVYQSPADDTLVQPGSGFVQRWTLKNTGSQTWRKDSVDIRFVSGDRVHSGSDVLDLPYDVSTGGMADILINMVAPSTAGTYTSNWALQEGGVSLCRFYVSFRVP
jgi:hypothetical protein